MSTTETPPRFQRRTARGHAQELDAPLPATVAELDGVQEANRKHRELAGRVAAAKQALADAHRELTEAEAADRERQIAAARAGRQSPSQRATAQAKAKVEESESVLDVLAEALNRSADELFGIAAPHFEEAAVALSDAHDAAIDRGRGLVAAAAEEFAHAAQLATERNKTIRVPRPVKHVRVAYSASAKDDVDGPLPASCQPRSGSSFSLGRTRVRCSAADANGNTVTASFVVFVRER